VNRCSQGFRLVLRPWRSSINHKLESLLSSSTTSNAKPATSRAYWFRQVALLYDQSRDLLKEVDVVVRTFFFCALQASQPRPTGPCGILPVKTILGCRQRHLWNSTSRKLGMGKLYTKFAVGSELLIGIRTHAQLNWFTNQGHDLKIAGLPANPWGLVATSF
jgi:hypothetical protein